MAAISLQGVCKHWGQAQAVSNIDFEVKSGQFTVLLGPSGCGKSTLLNLIAGLLKPSDGVLLCANREIGGPAPERA
ncbi:ATP-binding cassette domain-containing protein, partial [Acinetobacter baumannii]